MAQQTLEEAAEEYERNKYDNWNLHPDDHFLAGAKWQEERMYSEEDMREAFRGFSSGKSFKEWFEQFKK